MSEIWKTSCFSNEYSISNMGNVKRNSTGNIYSNKISNGKHRLYIKPLDLTITVSKEVLSAFHGKPDENQIIRFKNGDKLNCTLENLEWVKRGQYSTGIPRNPSSVEYSNPTGEIRELTWGTEKISVSSDGFVKENEHKWKKPTKPDPTRGYVSVWFPFNRNGEKDEKNKGFNYSIHIIIAEAFCERKNGQNEVDHIDGIKTNNVASNLRWVNKSENSANRDNNNDQNKKIVYKYKLGGEYTGEYFESLAFAAQSIGLTCSTAISGCINGKRPQSGNFEWSIFGPEEYKGRREGIMKMVKAHQNKEKEDRDAKKSPKKETGKRVYAHVIGTSEIIEWESGKDASSKVGIGTGNLCNYIKNKKIKVIELEGKSIKVQFSRSKEDFDED